MFLPERRISAKDGIRKDILFLDGSGGDVMDIYCIGEIVVDFLPGEGGDVYIRNFGGAPANVAVAAARNGLDAGVCCKVGDDDFGSFLEDTLKKENVRVLCRQRTQKAVTTMAFVTLGTDGERSFTFVRKPGADMFLSPEDVREGDVESALIVHGGSCSLSAEPSAAATVKALKLAKASDRIVSFDVNYRELMWNGRKEKCAAAVKGLFPYIDILKISEEEADMFKGEDNLPAVLKEYGLRAIVLTLGSRGAVCYYNEGKISAGGRKVPAADTTGAGDAFWGAFLSSLVIQGTRSCADITPSVLKNALEYGNAAGALSVMGKGAVSSMPCRAQIVKELAGRT